MKQALPPVTVLATFNDRISAEIGCALLSEASIHSGEPEPAEDGTWRVSVRRLHPELAGRAEVILRSARARETTIASDAQQTVYGCGEHRTLVHLRDQDDVPPAVVQEASGYSLPTQRTDVPELS
jgi:hypothetical protein